LEKWRAYDLRGVTRAASLVVVVTGLAGSGKTTVAKALADALDVPLISKDAIKEALFAAVGAGDSIGRRY
jgi:predicted kinase